MELYVGKIADAPEMKDEVRWNIGILVNDGIIIEIINDERRLTQVKEQQITIIELGEREFLIPGFVDTHCHASQYPYAGTGVDRPLMAEDGFLMKYAFPTEGAFEDKMVASAWYTTFLDEIIAQGTTCCALYATQHREASDILVDLVLERNGPRISIGMVAMDQLIPNPPSADQVLSVHEGFIQNTLNKTATKKYLIEPIITPRFLPSCSEQLLQGLGALAKKYNLKTQTHMSETIDEIDASKKAFPEFPTDAHALEHFGLLNQNTLLAHCCHMQPGEIEIVHKAQAAIVSCPLSNFYFAKAALPIKTLVCQHSLQVALSTDIAGGYSPSMLNAMRTAVLASKTLQFQTHPTSVFSQKNTPPLKDEDQLRNTHDLTHFEALYLATLGGATALGKAHLIGSFEVGKQFDALILDAGQSNIRAFPNHTAEQKK
mmetsp:Transcript_9185/g.14159  ORF Transcript_9185/g.14159 Transcript_9185/m.14159 type:complete len:431 (+) Transcript_9185:80-1372(+)